jgi:exonuclease III
MKGIFWNCNGFRDPKKHRFISDLTKEQDLSFIAISETGKRNLTPPFLKNLCAGRDFIWHEKEPRGRSGGILLGIDLSRFHIGAIDEGEYYVKFHLCNKEDNFKWALVVVYGPAQDDQKPNFLTELVQMGSRESLPILIGGDFNILRSPDEKNNNNYNGRWPFLFNAVIDGLNLRELEMSGRKYTWANARDNPTYEKLDRILMSTEWEQKFPLSTVEAITREISDHTPLLINTGHNHSCSNHTMFKFELGWLLRDGFADMVKNIWSNEVVSGTAMERWQAKIRRLRQHLRGWAKNVSGAYKKEKKKLLDTLDSLDKKAETTLLTLSEIDLKCCLNNRLTQLLHDEEVKWY